MTELPDPVEAVTVPERFSPSLLAMAKGCTLRAILAAGGAGRLPQTPAAERGTVFHKLLERAAAGVIPLNGEPWEVLEGELDKLLTEAHARLVSQPESRHFADLRKTLPQVAWYNTVQEILTTARHVAVWGAPSRVPAPRGLRPKLDFRSLTGPGRWVEVKVEAPELRIAGRVDVLERTPSGLVVVYDYKTGRVLDQAGSVLDHIALQLRLYALAIKSASPEARIELVVCRGERQERLPAEDPALAETAGWLMELLARLPPGGNVPARDLARPGADCRTCPHRHVCHSYQTTAPRYWKEGPEDFSWPLDTWGRVLSVERRGPTFAVDLEDAIGRRVRIHRLDSRHGELSTLQKGLSVWFFGLCASRSLVVNGVRVHPLNMYELPTESAQPRAWSLAVYTGR